LQQRRRCVISDTSSSCIFSPELSIFALFIVVLPPAATIATKKTQQKRKKTVVRAFRQSVSIKLLEYAQNI